LLKTRDRVSKTNPNKPKNKAEQLLKTRSCGKDKAKNKPGHVVENKRGLKITCGRSGVRAPLKSDPFPPHLYLQTAPPAVETLLQ
jgi:hypothetical protein